MELGQQIYNSRRDSPITLPGERPYAGWLYWASSLHQQSPTERRTLSLTLGTTGPPSLAEAVQTRFHAAVGFRHPQGWNDQLAAEPGLILAYRHDHLLLEQRLGSNRIAELVVHGAGELGNIRTALSSGIQGRMGFGIPQPWNHGSAEFPPFALYVLGGVQQRGVMHNIFLDGSLFRDGPHVQRRPFVTELNAGAGARIGRAEVEYVVTRRGREYQSEPDSHTYSSIILRFR